MTLREGTDTVQSAPPHRLRASLFAFDYGDDLPLINLCAVSHPSRLAPPIRTVPWLCKWFHADALFHRRV